MRHEPSSLPLIRRIAGKEITLFFASPIAYLFLATFAAVTLFIFFWGETFFSRNIADVRPLFEWMPLLLIFLASTLTMRLWSEERRTGTLEHVLTQPVPLWYFVVGKFSACLLLLVVALLITLPLPITVACIGELDWGPVLAGYLATLLLGAAYLSIGLFVSARSDNQIVSLISATALCGFFYLLGTSTVTDFFGSSVSQWLTLIGTGSRFESITRGVIDLRDLYYYLSIIAVFLTLNTYSLERERWAKTLAESKHRIWRSVTTLLVINALTANLWLGQISSLRIDTTAGQQYSLSDATRGYLKQLQEPLLLRGYFSSKTHPLLAPLVPQLRDLMREYEIAGHGKIRVEFVDPATDPQLEEEANQKFGIAPVPFQMADRYQASIVSSYFNVLVQYGDEYQVLGFQDLIEARALSEDDIDVQLRNPEYDLTRAIKKVQHSYQAGGNLFDTVRGDLVFNAYLSDDSALPPKLVEFKQAIMDVVNAAKDDSGGQLTVNVHATDADGGKIGAQITEQYGFKPMTTSLLSEQRFYFYLTLSQGDQIVQIPLGDYSKDSFERNFKAGIKRFASGFTKSVAVVAPPSNPAMAAYGYGGSQFQQLETLLGSDLNLLREDLSDGQVSGEADVLLLLAPNQLNEKQLFAIDQYLMQGGTVIAAASPYSASFNNRSLGLKPANKVFSDWLAHNGLTLGQQLVMDPQNSSFPIPVTRDIGGYKIQEMRSLDYPYFVDLRATGMNQQHPITANIPQLTLTWAAPIRPATDQNGRTLTELLHSSNGSWLSASTDVMPRIGDGGGSGYQAQGETHRQLLGVISTGRFDSYFADKPSPLTVSAAGNNSGQNNSDQSEPVINSLITRSPESARIILFSSSDFLNDQILQLAGSATRSEYLNTLQLISNAIDWSLEDSGLLSIRARSHFNRTLPPMEHSSQLFWEYLNYVLAAALLGLVALLQQQRKRRRQQRYLTQLTQ